MKKREAIVVGGGHAGIEAVFSLANLGHKVTLISLDNTKLAMMPCNPSIGGPAKGILTKEIDALGGMQGIFSDKAMIQIKMLNDSKGPAVRALRAQIDKDKYSEIVFDELSKHENIEMVEALIDEILVKDNVVTGVKDSNGIIYNSEIVILTTGTYMDSRTLRGSDIKKEGPDGLPTSANISASLKKLGFNLLRLKTGTPPRVFTSSIDFSEVEEEVLDNYDYSFSSRTEKKLEKQMHCYLTYTNAATHKVILDNLDKSSMYSGAIDGIGPRYCPSVEDKIVRFQDKPRHQIFYEPETTKGDTIYVNGLSTSMPVDVQDQMLKTLPGMKNAKVSKWGYAIEYDAIDPFSITITLETKNIKGLFFAGQINGTSGYEEAACQGLMAGINASQKLKKAKPVILTRDQAYIGVLLDDLITKGTKEPYRMLTSRAEYRLLLRNDNVDERLSHIGNEIGLLPDSEYKKVVRKYKIIDEEIIRLAKTFISSKSEIAKKYNIDNGQSYLQLLSRPAIDINDFTQSEFAQEVAIKIKLKGYINKQIKDANKMLKLESFKIPEDINYDDVENIAGEARQKFMDIKPKTIGQAQRISGINPADIQMLMFYLEYKRKKHEA